MEKIRIRDEKKLGARIRDKHPGPATLVIIMLRSACVILRVEAGRGTIRAEVETGEAGNPLMCLQSTGTAHAASFSSLLPRVHLLLLLLFHCPVQMTVADMATLLQITGEQSAAHKAGEAVHPRFRFLFAVPARRMLLSNVRKDRFMRGKIYAAQRAEIGGLFLIFLFVVPVGLFGPAVTQSVCGGAWQPILFFSFISANAADSALPRGLSTAVVLP
jgi:hypothetical protein